MRRNQHSRTLCIPSSQIRSYQLIALNHIKSIPRICSCDEHADFPDEFSTSLSTEKREMQTQGPEKDQW